MEKFNSYGTLADLARETFDRHVKKEESWDFFLNNAERRFPGFFPTWSDVENEDYRVRTSCDNLDFQVYQNIIKENEIIEVWSGDVCDVLFEFLDAFKINEICVKRPQHELGELRRFFEQKGWKPNRNFYEAKKTTFIRP